MKHTKKNFKAMRELLGMSQQLLADLMQVDVRSVRRWESPKMEDYRPPEDAWDILERFHEKQNWIIDTTLSNLDEVEEQMEGKPRTVNLSYWASAEEYEAAHPGEGKYWQMANANSRAVAVALGDEYEVEFGGDGE